MLGDSSEDHLLGLVGYPIPLRMLGTICFFPFSIGYQHCLSEAVSSDTAAADLTVSNSHLLYRSRMVHLLQPDLSFFFHLVPMPKC